MVLFPPLHVGCPHGFAPEAALEDLGLPLVRATCGDAAAAWVAGVLAAPGSQGSWRLQQWKYSALEGIGQYAPVFFPGDAPPP